MTMIATTPLLLSSVHCHDNGAESWRLHLQSEQDEFLSQEPHLNRSYEHASSQVRSVPQIPDEETPGNINSLNLSSGSQIYQSNFANRSCYDCRRYTCELQEHCKSNSVEQQPATDLGIDSPYTPSRGVSENCELSENATRYKVDGVRMNLLQRRYTQRSGF